MPAQPVQPPADEPSEGAEPAGIPAVPPPDDPLRRGEWEHAVLDTEAEAEMARRRADAVRRFRGRPDG